MAKFRFVNFFEINIIYLSQTFTINDIKYITIQYIFKESNIFLFYITANFVKERRDKKGKRKQEE